MPTYGLLLFPSYNRVYFESSLDLAVSELELANACLDKPFEDIGREEIAGINYISFSSKDPLSPDQIRLLSRLSFVYALFEFKLENKEPSLSPLLLHPNPSFSDDIISILKYTGKTNESFTKLLVNIAWMTSDSFGKDRPHLLDPVCGRGTSLFQGLIYGFNVSGLDLDKNAIEKATAFLGKYLKTKRIKHKISQTKISENKKKICDIKVFETNQDKKAYKAGDKLIASFYRADTRHCAKLIKHNSIDMIVGDLPYGVQHGSHAATGSFSRKPAGLLQEALPGWYKLLRKGGSIALSWNKNLASRDELIDILEAAGFSVFTGGPFDGFSHRVDQAIIRDIIVGKK
ncbi:MAG: hypothetical protein WC097_07915 [Eubacteriales bacterium]